MTSAIARVAAAPPPASESVQSSAVPGASLLPEGQALSGTGIDDALGVLYAAMAAERQSNFQSSESRVSSAETQEKQALADEQAAEAREEANQAKQGRGFFSSIGHLVSDVAGDVTHGRLVKAAEDTVSDVKAAVDSPAFWSDLEQGAMMVARVAAVVGSTVVAGATLGIGTPLAVGVTVLSVSGEVVSDTKCLGKYSQDVGLGLQMAGAATGLVGGLASTTMNTASRTALAIGASINGLGGEAQMVAGGAHIESQVFAARVENAAADAQHAVNQDSELEQTVRWVIDDLKTSDKSRQTAEQAVGDAVEDNDKGMAAAAASISVKG